MLAPNNTGIFYYFMNIDQFVISGVKHCSVMLFSSHLLIFLQI